MRILGFDYAVGVDSTTKVMELGPGGRRRTTPETTVEVARRLGKEAYRRITWREGTRRHLASRFAFRRVRLANADGIPLEEHEPLWLLMEWPFGESESSQFAVTTLPAKMSKKQIELHILSVPAADLAAVVDGVPQGTALLWPRDPAYVDELLGKVEAPIDLLLRLARRA